MTTTISANIDKRLANQLTRQAKAEQSSKSTVLKKALIDYLEEQDLIQEYNSRKLMIVKEVSNNDYMTLTQFEKSLKKK